MDGFGFQEYAVGAPFARQVRGDHNASGAVLLFSGRDHGLLRVIPGWVSASPVRDRDGDGARDLLLGRDPDLREPHRFEVVSSATGEILLEFHRGEQVLGETSYGLLLSDPRVGEWLKLEGPPPARGRRDVVGARRGTSWFLVPGRDEILSVDETGMLIAYSLPSGPEKELGRPTRPGWANAAQLAIATGDADGDGEPDLLVGNPRAQRDAGGVVVVSGRTGRILHEVALAPEGQESSFVSALGHSVAFVGDLDGDGNEDFAVGEPGNFGGGLAVFGGCDALWSWSLNDDAFSPNRDPRSFTQPGVAMTPLHDYDGDGFVDLLVGGGQCVFAGTPWLSGSVSIVSARTGECLFRRHELDLPVLFGEEGK
jgi:hypothetical protein